MLTEWWSIDYAQTENVVAQDLLLALTLLFYLLEGGLRFSFNKVKLLNYEEMLKRKGGHGSWWASNVKSPNFLKNSLDQLWFPSRINQLIP